MYIERVQQYLEANDLEVMQLAGDRSNEAQVKARNSKRRAILLSVIGGSAYALVRNLLSPEKPADKSFDDIVKTLKDHYNPTSSVPVHRYRFNTRNRQPGESVPDYISNLRKLAEDCDFGANLNDQLRDRLLCGINDDTIQRRLLTEKDLTLDKAYQIAAAQELATKNVKILQGKDPGASTSSAISGAAVNRITSRDSRHNTSRSQKGNSSGASTKPRDSTQSKPTAVKTRTKICYRCGDTSHLADKCEKTNMKCTFCKKNGHVKSACLKLRNRNQTSERVNQLNDSCVTDELYNVTTKEERPIYVDVQMNGVPIKFQLDTGSSVTVINENDFRKSFGSLALHRSDRSLGSYSGHRIKVVGECEVEVHIGMNSGTLPLVVVEGSGPPLLGRTWLQRIQLPWHSIFDGSSCIKQEVNQISTDIPETLLKEFEPLFLDELGCLKKFKAHFEIQTDAVPVFCKARPLPFAMKKRMEEALTQLEKSGVIEKVQHSDWAAPVVKPNGTLRICGDYKLTINKVIQLDRYPLPLVDEIFAALNGGKLYTRLDLQQAYHQIQLDDDSKKLTVINTPFGLYQFVRLPYGASPCVGLFQRAMENLLKGLPGVSVFLDDILVTGKDEAEHMKNLRTVLKILQENGLRLRKEKCRFALREVEYLGFKVSADGIHPAASKVEAIRNAQRPNSVSQLRSFIGLVNYYARFQKNLAHHMAPLYCLLKKDKSWEWTSTHESAFRKIKGLISDSAYLAHYDPNAELVLTCDASPVGIGAVLEIRSQDQLQPIAFISRSLNKAERHYAQIEREALAIVFAVQRFRQYLLGRRFTLRTDHRPLTTIFSDSNGIPQMASSRLKRWALILSAYTYDVQYISTKENGCADFLSRAPLENSHYSTLQSTTEEVLQMEELPLEMPITASVVARETLKDPTLAKVLQLTKEGWPTSGMDRQDLQPYFTRRNELSIEKGCLL